MSHSCAATLHALLHIVGTSASPLPKGREELWRISEAHCGAYLKHTVSPACNTACCVPLRGQKVLGTEFFGANRGFHVQIVPLRRRRLKKGALPLQRLQDSDQDFNVGSTADSCEDDRSGMESEPKAIIPPKPSIVSSEKHYDSIQ
ncbi:hypothetical protein QAD02_014310 [Eretmocerus hayati]|uniref:Uncharacterized protein n=1 Tax=Eretmocerus hayati TaxID=131215 RepID=A0ACC2P5X4_9HYME|nr:hypothetical protein QAD02_014310 [Eretmocerus hayati]